MSMTEAYFALGAANHLRGLADGVDFDQLGFMDELTSYAHYAEALCNMGHRVTGGYPGVPYYEIDDPFGNWFGEQSKVEEVAPEAAFDKLIELTSAFFTKAIDQTDPDAEQLALKLAAGLDAVTRVTT
jgi:hypothetical protein